MPSDTNTEKRCGTCTWWMAFLKSTSKPYGSCEWYPNVAPFALTDVIKFNTRLDEGTDCPCHEPKEDGADG